MSGVEIAALGVLGLGYLDAKHHIRKDLYSTAALIHNAVKISLAAHRGRLNLWYLFEQQASKRPNKLFLIYPEPLRSADTDSIVSSGNLDGLFRLRRYTYRQVYDIVLRYSAYLAKEHKIKEGSVVAMDFVNKPEFIFVWFALWQLGAVPAMINYNLTDKPLIHCVKVSQSQLLIVDVEVGENTLKASEGINVPIVIADAEHFKHVLSTYEPYLISPEQRGNPALSDPSCLIFTSGTTGMPKAAGMSWKKAWSAGMYSDVNEIKSSDTLYSAMPLYHSTAAVLGFLASLHVGATYAIGHKFSTTTFWTQVKLTQATAIQYVGETCRYLLNAPPCPDETKHNVRMALGNGLRPDVWKEFKRRFQIPRICEFYGATEFPGAIVNVQDGNFGIGGAGHFGDFVLAILRATRFDIVRIDQETQEIWRDPKTGLGVRANRNEPGEFLFKVDRKNTVLDFQGYKGDTKASNEKLIFDVFKKGDAWVRTGDLLRLDDENCYHFVDRLGDTFRWKSENVSTNEVEEALSGDPHIEQSVVVGVQVPNHEGRAGFAVVQLKRPEDKPDLNELGAMLCKTLPRYAVPIFLKFVPSISATGNNKIQKKLFRDQKIPSQGIYWLQGERYVPLTDEGWAAVQSGQTKL